MRLLRFIIVCSFLGAGLNAAPAVAGVYNAASWVVPHQTNSGIAQGALFTVTGTGLGPTTIQHANSYPLPTTQGLAGTTIQGHAEMTQVGAGAGPEFPFQFGENISGVGESGAPAQVDGAADVVGVGVGEDHGVDILGADAGHLEARLDGAGSGGVFAGPGIHEHDMASGFDEQACIGAEHFVGREVMAFQGAAEIGGVGVGEEPGSRVRVIAVAENGAIDGSDLEAMRALWHM